MDKEQEKKLLDDEIKEVNEQFERFQKLANSLSRYKQKLISERMMLANKDLAANPKV